MHADLIRGAVWNRVYRRLLLAGNSLASQNKKYPTTKLWSHRENLPNGEYVYKNNIIINGAENNENEHRKWDRERIKETARRKDQASRYERANTKIQQQLYSSWYVLWYRLANIRARAHTTLMVVARTRFQASLCTLTHSLYVSPASVSLVVIQYSHCAFP